MSQFFKLRDSYYNLESVSLLKRIKPLKSKFDNRMFYYVLVMLDGEKEWLTEDEGKAIIPLFEDQSKAKKGSTKASSSVRK